MLTEATALSTAIDTSDRGLLGGYYIEPHAAAISAFVERFSAGGAPETFRPLTWSNGSATAAYAGGTTWNSTTNYDAKFAVAWLRYTTATTTPRSTATARLSPRSPARRGHRSSRSSSRRPTSGQRSSGR